MGHLDELNILLNSRRRLILVETFEEERFQKDLKDLLENKGYNGYAWSLTGGLDDIIMSEQVEEPRKISDPVRILDFIMNHEEQAVFLLKDFHELWTNVNVKRKLRDILESQSRVYKPIIVTAPVTNVPLELEKNVTVIHYELPTREEVIEQLSAMETYLDQHGLPKPEGREREAIINALVGMTESEIVNVLKKSVSKHKRVVLDEIVAEKEQVIRKTGLLEYISKIENMDHVGGMDMLKEWLADARYSFDEESRNYNIDPVRGAILCGFPGTGKSLVCKSIAHFWNLPLLRMNMSSIMDSKVGQSEKNIYRALRIAESVSPCILWIDELEKGLAGLSSSDRTDGGTMSRVIQELLTWLSEKTAPVFVIATANNVTSLPPELTRAGRFDEVFFISLPHQEEREEILKIHLKKRGYKVGDMQEPNIFSEREIARLARQMEGFSGAEIEQVVAEAGRKAYAQFRKGMRDSHYIQVEDMERQIETIVPLSKRDKELLSQLRKWAKHSARCASSKEHEYLHQKPAKDSVTVSSSFSKFEDLPPIDL